MATKPVWPGSEESKVFVGNWKSPVAIIKRSEIKEYLDDEFWAYYECWRVHDAGLGLPFGNKWIKYPEKFIHTITLFSGEWATLKGPSK